MSNGFQAGFPNAALTNSDGSLTDIGQQFLFQLFQRTGGENGFLSGANFPDNPANQFFATPANEAGVADFRAIASADLSNVAGEYPATATNDNAASGNIGEFSSSQLDSTHGIGLSSGVAADILLLALSPGDWDVWGSIGIALGSGNITTMNAWLSATSATDPNPPNNGAYFQFANSLSGGAQTLTTGPLTAPLGMMRQSLGQATTIYLSTMVSFTGSGLKGFGFIGARRRR
jgi:hypothetical protein